ncbi:hypothetical protein RFI_31493 [Reticulomyxa filosa]|uniref:Uncharacterized protein n=1 Tax=Reticulomyxa filosa TaxID=46433 RepID=X6LVH4_RETFI|nr:hypothetical protein RFI_31493 [Reticulomyxa filosa]|eukprot:ETO05903.1 hypothetical protein RFI_31493 [Reticulomyxa filosa]
MEKDATEEILRQQQIGYGQSQKTINCEDDNEKKEQASFLEFVEFAVILPKKELKNIVKKLQREENIKNWILLLIFLLLHLRKADCSKGICIDLERCFIYITNMKIYGFCLVNIIFAKIALHDKLIEKWVKDKKIKKEKYVMYFRKVIESMCMEKVYGKTKISKYL